MKPSASSSFFYLYSNMCTLLCTHICYITKKPLYLRKRQKHISTMYTLTVRDFRSNMASSFDKVDAGERVLIRRKRQTYALIPVNDDDLTITPELQARIEEARREHKEGRTLTFKTASEAQRWMDEL